MGKVFENQQEDCSSQSEVIRRSVGPSSSRVVAGWRLQKSMSAWVSSDRSTSPVHQQSQYGSGW